MYLWVFVCLGFPWQWKTALICEQKPGRLSLRLSGENVADLFLSLTTHHDVITLFVILKCLINQCHPASETHFLFRRIALTLWRSFNSDVQRSSLRILVLYWFLEGKYAQHIRFTSYHHLHIKIYNVTESLSKILSLSSPPNTDTEGICQ